MKNKGYLGHKHTEESKKKISEGLKGRVCSEATREKLRKANAGHVMSEEQKEKLRITNTGRKHPPRSEEWSKKLSKSLTGKKRSEESKKKQSLSKIGKSPALTEKRLAFYARNKGENNNKWKGGITPLVRQIRNLPQMRQWRDDIFQRDDYTCQMCGDRGGCGHTVKLEAHHVKRFSIIFEEYKIKSLEDALNCAEMWNTNNGLTLCEKCHKPLGGLNKKK